MDAFMIQTARPAAHAMHAAHDAAAHASCVLSPIKRHCSLNILRAAIPVKPKICQPHCRPMEGLLADFGFTQCHMLERKFTKIGGQVVNGPKSEFRSPPPPMCQHATSSHGTVTGAAIASMALLSSAKCAPLSTSKIASTERCR